MRGLTYEVSFTDFDINFNADLVTISNEHRFLDGEEVTYLATGTPIGIGSTAVGFGTDRLTSGASYFLKKVSDTQFQIHASRNDFIVGINTVDFNATGNKQHTFRSKMVRTVIDRILVTDSTDDFSSKKVVVDGQACLLQIKETYILHSLESILQIITSMLEITHSRMVIM